MGKTELFSYCKNGKWGLVDKDKNIIVPLVFEEEIFFYDDYAAAKLDGKYGFIDRNGNTIIAYMYDNAGLFQCNVGDVCLDGKWGCVDKFGKLVIPCEHLLPLSFNSPDEVVAVNKGGDWNHVEGEILGGKWGLINTKGELVKPYQYDEIFNVPNSYIQVKINKKYGLFDLKGNEILACEFSKTHIDSLVENSVCLQNN